MEGIKKDNVEQTLSVAWQVDKYLTECLTELYDKKLWTDISIRCKDHDEGECIRAHKIILAARSPVFQSMFFGACADAKDDIYLDQVDANTLDLFLRYVYSDDVELSEENAASVLEVAHYYKVSNLVEQCSAFLTSILSVENAFVVLDVSMFYSLTTLRDACYAFIDRQADKILNSEAFLELSADHLHRIIKGDTFYANENDIFKRVVQWAERKLFKKGKKQCTGAEIRSILDATFYYLRLPTMDYATLMECIRKKGYLSLDEYEDINDFINGIPSTSVKSNSCVKRLQVEETLILSSMDGLYSYGDCISTSFNISVSRDVIITNFTLSNISMIVQYDHQYFSTENSRAIDITHPSINNFFKEYEGNALILKYPSLKQVHTLQKVSPKNLPGSLKIPIVGHFTIKQHKRKVSETSQENKLQMTPCSPVPVEIKGEPENRILFSFNIPTLSIPSCHDQVSSGDTEYEEELLYEQNFMLTSENISGSTVSLTNPFKLSKVTAPYTIGLSLKLGCRSSIQLKAVCAEETICLWSEREHIKIDNIRNHFAGIKSIAITNTSRRDSDETCDL